MNLDLFSSVIKAGHAVTHIIDQVWHLEGFATSQEIQLRDVLRSIIKQAPLRQMKTSSGQLMSVKMTNCGDVGWVSDSLGYRYQALDPISNLPWPAMPKEFKGLAKSAAAAVGFDNFEPDACLINLYPIGARLSLHQDKDEMDFDQPIVSVSLGLPATFVLAGLERSSPQTKIPLHHGDVVVWGGASRLAFHGVLPVAAGEHPLFSQYRVNLTFRKAR